MSKRNNCCRNIYTKNRFKAFSDSCPRNDWLDS